MAEAKGQGGDKAADDQNKPAEAKAAPAVAVIEMFGGIRPMAKDLGVAVSTVQGWKERASIPANRHDQIRAAAGKKGLKLDPDLLRASAQPDATVVAPPVIDAEAQKNPDAAAAAPAQPEKKPAEADPGVAGSMASRAAAAASQRRASSEPPPKTGSTPPPQAKRRSSAPLVSGLLLGVVLAAGIAVATVYTRGYWLPLIDPQSGQQNQILAEALSGLDQRIAELQATLPADNSAAVQSLNERLGALELAVSQGAGQDPETRAAIESLSASLARVTDRLQSIEDGQASLGAPTEALTNRLSSEAARLDEVLTAQSELGARLDAAEDALAGAAASRDAAPGSQETLMLLAMLQLRDAIRGSGPYDEPLRMLQNLTGDDPLLAETIAPLERRSTAGLPALADLQAAFPEVARRIAAIELGEEGEGWSAGVLRRLSEAVNLRPVGLVEGDQATAVAARAEVKLNEGDLVGALAELDGLSGAAAEAAAAWRSDAEARIAANQAVSRLGALVSDRFRLTVGG